MSKQVAPPPHNLLILLLSVTLVGRVDSTFRERNMTEYIGAGLIWLALSFAVAPFIGRWLRKLRRMHGEPEKLEHQDGPGDRGLLDR